ncbi:MAG: dehydrogenase [Verrucomicrobiales bacterium]|nr:dehydrogenase [Verrucomicrobiales bacterium]
MNRLLVCLLILSSCCGHAAKRVLHTAVDPFAPNEAARTMKVPAGFKVSLFAGEPDVKQPIGFCIDDRGRLWVAEAYSYPKHSDSGNDRILIFEDTDHDGRFDKRTVFYDKLNYVSGIEVGFGGAWVMSPPCFYFIPDGDYDDRPDGEPILLLDGFGTHANSHNIANGFSWGPDGWLYGTHGRTNYSWPDKPGTPKDKRKQYDGGVWRYHPIKHIWEPYADGTTNPWGIDWDDYGQGFVCNCVNPHLFHVIQGAHYEPGRNRESSRYAYERIPTIADHRHFIGGNNVRDQLGTEAESLLGGGHAHSGTMVYLGDNWPDRYRNTVFMNNIHGRRINNDLLMRKGSGYTALHSRDIMMSEDPWYMGVTVRYGPDGGVFASDWSDTGECHSTRNTRKHTGRLYKITYGKTKPFTLDLPRMSNSELVDLQFHKNDWLVSHARRLLQERYAFGMNMGSAAKSLLYAYRVEKDIPAKLRLMWAMKVINRTDDSFLFNQMLHESEYIRSWAIKLACEDRNPPANVLQRMGHLARNGTSQFVRLHLASAMQRLKPANRWPLAEMLSKRAEDIEDDNLPLMYWYGIHSLIDDNLGRFANLAARTKIPLVRRHAARRASSMSDAKGTRAIVNVMPTLDSSAQSDMIDGVLKGLEGRSSMPMPEKWPIVYASIRKGDNAKLRQSATRLALIFNDRTALDELRKIALDSTAKKGARVEAIQSLVQKKVKGVPLMLFALMKDEAVQREAIRGLAAFNHSSTASRLIESYPELASLARTDVLQTLAARKSWASALLGAMESGTINPRDLSSYTARQVLSLKDRQLTSQLEMVWGKLDESSEAKRKEIDSFKRRLSAKTLARADLKAGHELFKLACSVCHQLKGEGNHVGPDLTGAQRNNLEYLLENIVDPSASVARDYQMQILKLNDGRTISGFVTGENEASLTVRTLNEQVIVPRRDIKETTKTSKSIMPDGLLKAMSSEQARDLIGFLMKD